MGRPPASRPLLAAAAVVALFGGELAARAQGMDPAPPRRVPAPAGAPVVPALPCPAPRRPARATAGGPSRELLDAFGVLRRERRPEDTLPAQALRALRAAGLEPARADAARLMRSTPTGGRAWVVPVPDVRAALAFGGACPPVLVSGPVPRGLPQDLRPRRAPRVRSGAKRTAPAPPRPSVVPLGPAPGGAPALPPPPRGGVVVPPKPVPGAPPAPRGGAVVPPTSVRGAPPALPMPPRGGAVVVRPARPAPGRAAGKPVEGLAVVALGDAAAGGGGSRADLVRGRAPVDVDPCAGPRRDMLGVSGLVPDGVGAVYLTSPDGTAVRADVRDNGFSFVVARPATAQPRYVVWTGAEGTPHVQPVAGAALGRGGCAGGRPATRPRVTPGAACPALPAVVPAGARRRIPRGVPLGPCVLPAAPAPAPPRIP